MTATIEQERLLIGETWMPGIAGTVRDVLDPASREASLRSPTPTRQTLSPGPAAFDDGAWRGLTGAQRARSLWRIADLIEEHVDERRRLETREGQPGHHRTA